MRHLDICVLALMLATASGAAAQVGGEAIVIGESIRLYSRVYDQEFRLSIYLPDGYARSSERYPVLYTVQAYSRHTAGTVAQLSGVATPELIYVHVDTYNSGDLLPTRIESRPSSGGADRFLAFFREDLIPFIDSTYRTQPFRILHSGSWGGVFCLYAVLTQPDLFNAHIAAVPWLIYDGDESFMLTNAESLINRQRFDKNFVFVGLGNDPDPGLRESVEAIAEMLESAQKQGLRFKYVYWGEEDHFSTGHKAIFDGLRWTFQPWSEVPQSVLLKGRDAIQQYREALAGLYGFDIGLHTGSLFRMGYQLMGQGELEKAIDMFELCVEMSPDTPSLYSALGRAYERSGQLDNAMSNFEAAYELARQRSESDLARYSDDIERVRRKLAEKR
jgi:predicted alpha/beta superfamily hydrolase